MRQSRQESRRIQRNGLESAGTLARPDDWIGVAMLDRISVSEAEEVRFWAQVDLLAPIQPNWPSLGNCWLWKGNTTKHKFPYGYMYLRGRANNELVHRIGHALTKGYIPLRYQVDHLCRRSLCVRHTELVTQAENLRRRDLAKKGAYWAEVG
jgi:hypothetical protein